ncbi:hypothetical protein FRACYDRAFT_241349 [Fragilariopsis cylindrus CCMP1102]|uniref:Uncharacterized protein n=1 Tax=Fragilariopsis cylindrus CCMP1102 TaxID=635003 RepID=A0A1E7F9V2_9STRA|nr:hypothetical protein FRACYDRAFT_241349 [Fragilariopsis cylindrus CCMP1102]|eukprot:OEU14795.1 hypothetical protein FRACYDRAFT_241349 [Fragilariopsis cylindrus CCMP1102]
MSDNNASSTSDNRTTTQYKNKKTTIIRNPYATAKVANLQDKKNDENRPTTTAEYSYDDDDDDNDNNNKNCENENVDVDVMNDVIVDPTTTAKTTNTNATVSLQDVTAAPTHSEGVNNATTTMTNSMMMTTTATTKTTATATTTKSCDYDNTGGNNMNNTSTTTSTSTHNNNNNNNNNKTSDLAFWERLPSRTISFGAAEILTVTECIQHSKLYYDQNCSIRVTGLLQHRCFLPLSLSSSSSSSSKTTTTTTTNDYKDCGGVVVQLELKDPVVVTSTRISSSRKKRTSNTTSTGNNIDGSNIGGNNSNNNGLRRSSTTPTTRRRSSLLPSSSSRKLLSTTKKQKRKRPWFVLVDPRMTQLDVAIVGSFITIIGNFIAIPMVDDDDMNNGDKEQDGAIVAASTAATILHVDDDDEKKEDNNNNADGENNNNTRSPLIAYHRGKSCRYKLEARTLQVINNSISGGGGTDLTLYGMALRSRRKTMYRRYYYNLQCQQQQQLQQQQPQQLGDAVDIQQQENKNAKKKDDDDEDVVLLTTVISLLQGCGPPPYEKFKSRGIGLKESSFLDKNLKLKVETGFMQDSGIDDDELRLSPLLPYSHYISGLHYGWNNTTAKIRAPHNDKHDFLQHSTPSLLSPKAYPVYGTHVEFDYNRGTKNNNSITVVYALPSHRHHGSGGGGGNSTIRSSIDNSNNDIENNHNNIINIKGIVILLHACTHNAFKFFSPSNDKCPECVGLSEELRLVRNVLNRGYVAFAVTCSNLQSGCWGGDDDVDRIRLYLAPMTKDKGTAKRVRENYNYLMGKQHKQKILQSLSSSQNNTNTNNNNNLDVRTSLTVEVRVDEESCRSLPVTVDYLWNRVPGMTMEVSTIIVDVLIKANHIDPNNNYLLIVDPTKSNWRDLLLQQQQQDATTKDGIVNIPQSLQQQQQQQKLSTTTTTTKSNNMLWGTFDLTPGMSPLAKALHRAWAMHEYCSESINPALDFFEQQ